MKFADIPVDQWVVLLVEHPVRWTYDMYMFKRNPDGSRTALQGGDTYRRVPEGVELPVWQQISREVVQQTKLLNAFKHVYKVSTVLERYTA